MLEKYDYGSEYQDHILACLIKHPKRFMAYTGVLNSAFFSGTARIASARTLLNYWKKHSRFPTWDVLSQEIHSAIARTAESKDEEAIQTYVKKIGEMDTGDVDQIVNEVVTFARRRAFWIAFDEGMTYYQKGEEPPGGFESLFKEASKIGLDLEDMGYWIGPGCEGDICTIVEKYFERGRGVKFGGNFHHLDDVWKNKGGVGPGWLIAILAPPKRFKTTFCINLAMSIAFEDQQPVFYYPCEITQIDASVRCLQCLTDQTDDFMAENTGAFTEMAIKNANELMQAPLLIKGFPSRTVSIGKEIRAHALASKRQFGIEPKAIFIDFAETVKCGSTKKDISDHRAQAEIYVEARALGAEMNCPVFLPDRCNAETVDKTVPSMRSFQGAFEKAGHVDGAIGLCASEQEHQEGIIRYFIFLNRHGEAGLHYRGIVNAKTMRMTMEEKIPWNPEDDEEEPAGKKPRFRRQRGKRPPDVDKMLDG